jgi:hypothetical protein
MHLTLTPVVEASSSANPSSGSSPWPSCHLCCGNVNPSIACLSHIPRPFLGFTHMVCHLFRFFHTWGSVCRPHTPMPCQCENDDDDDGSISNGNSSSSSSSMTTTAAPAASQTRTQTVTRSHSDDHVLRFTRTIESPRFTRTIVRGLVSQKYPFVHRKNSHTRLYIKCELYLHKVDTLLLSLYEVSQ